MLVISLTTIPPRFAQLPEVLEGLLAQGADKLVVVIARRPARFAPAPLPDLPVGVEAIETEPDMGPAGKLLAPARRFPGADILYCDDDWRYGPGWADALRAAQVPGAVTAASTWPTARIGRSGGTIAQGFAGVLVAADAAARIPDPPAAAWAVDDIWLSGHFAAMGLPIHTAPAARACLTPLASPAALQHDATRDSANRAAAALIHDRFGIWPPL